MIDIIIKTILLFLISRVVFAQQNTRLNVEKQNIPKGFNGAVLIADNDQLSTYYVGYSNFQFNVPITSHTRFPVASITKLFTSILILHLVEKSVIRIEDKIGMYIPNLEARFCSITLKELLTHHSGISNEPIEYYQSKYSIDDFVRKFLHKRSDNTFNYNNSDYILLTYVLESITKKSFAALVRDNILNPAHMQDSGVVVEDNIIEGLAYGYHIDPEDSISHRMQNDEYRYISNYFGAGSMYSTVKDLHSLLVALRENRLLSSKCKREYLISPQSKDFSDQARGYSTIGFYYNNKTFKKPVLERRGSIDGFNTVILSDTRFSKIIIMLCNTDAVDLELFCDSLYN